VQEILKLWKKGQQALAIKHSVNRELTASPLMIWLAALNIQKLLVAQAVEME